MWFATLLTSGAASFGRVLIVGLLPNAVPLVFLWALLRAGSFTGQSDWRLLLPADTRGDLVTVLLVLFGITLLTVVAQPFQIRLVRILEGYWEGWWLTARLAPVFVEYQYRKVSRLRERFAFLSNDVHREFDDRMALSELSREYRARARRRSELSRVEAKLQRYPAPVSDGAPDEGEEPIEEVRLLPTGLGNALRTGETSAGERYGLETVSSWPRLYPHFSDKFIGLQASARDALDAAANLTISFLIVTVLGMVALFDEPKAYWIPAAAFGLFVLSYLGSIAAAVEYTTFVRVAYDLHRFDLVKAMHHPLPDNPVEEYRLFRKLSAFFLADAGETPVFGLAREAFPEDTYDHSHKSEDKTGSSADTR
ncbi:MAG TPA: hypothetical protein VFV67_16770 [Actinophytocola sp.]|uniref:hypothetical protein n=1 Tax=Actinophytocola sp. TaxID=1872138 RepID=UPI002DBC7A82|nr:hypothetical protein [Actinophytocola sp.]HEU5472307.1 hypothetical protein [Actinophytocola sp.]